MNIYGYFYIFILFKMQSKEWSASFIVGFFLLLLREEDKSQLQTNKNYGLEMKNKRERTKEQETFVQLSRLIQFVRLKIQG